MIKEIPFTSLQGYGDKLYTLMKEIFPILQSITGEGSRKTLSLIKKEINELKIYNVRSGTKVFDWIVPKEWNIKEAYIKNSNGEKIVDLADNNLHILNYSIPFRGKVSLHELKEHLFSIPEYPEWIPYATSYYNENWGFCISHRKLEELKEDTYEVVIESSLNEGHLSYGEVFLQGKSFKEILLTTYFCHPSMCNDNLSGVVTLTFLTKLLKKIRGLHFSYRILFLPETIGSITWLALNEEKVKNIEGGLVVTCTGGPSITTYKRTWRGDFLIDKVVEKVLVDSREPYKVLDFFPGGSDERQFASPAFRLPMSSLMKSSYWTYPEYHTSADNFDFVKPEQLENTFKKYIQVISILENNITYVGTNPKCEPNLGKRGLYNFIGAKKNQSPQINAMRWILYLSDGNHSLLDIALKSNLSFESIHKATFLLIEKGLLTPKENV